MEIQAFKHKKELSTTFRSQDIVGIWIKTQIQKKKSWLKMIFFHVPEIVQQNIYLSLILCFSYWYKKPVILTHILEFVQKTDYFFFGACQKRCVCHRHMAVQKFSHRPKRLKRDKMVWFLFFSHWIGLRMFIKYEIHQNQKCKQLKNGYIEINHNSYK